MTVNTNNGAIVISRVTELFENLNINSSFELKDVHLNKMMQNKNSARMKGECLETIKNLANLINNGKYNPELHIPPVVEFNKKDGNYTIISGHHRFKAHKLAKKTKMTCIVTKFSDDYQRSVWRTFENSEASDSFVKKYSDEKNNVSLIANLVQTKIVSDDRDSIERFIRDAKLAYLAKTVKSLTDKVLARIGKVDSDYVKTYEKSEDIAKEFQDKYPDIKFISQTFKSKIDSDYDERVRNKMVDSFLQFPEKPIALIYSVVDNEKDEVLEIRNYKTEHLVSDLVKKCREVTRLHDEGYSLNDIVTLHPLPQTGKEIAGDDEGMNKFKSNLDKTFSEKASIKNENVHVLIDKVKNCKSVDDVHNVIELFFGADAVR